MFPENVTHIIEKHKKDNSSDIRNINDSILNIISCLDNINRSIAAQTQQLLIDKNTENNAEELLHDSITLRNYINSIKVLSIDDIEYQQKQNNQSSFLDKITVYVISDDLCPSCNVKLVPKKICYQRIIDNKILNESVNWYICPSCNKFLALDYDIEYFDKNNTNIQFNIKYYEKISFYDTIVIFNINKCSKHNHNIEDIKCNIPIIVPTGKIVYTQVPLIHCKTCKRYIMLKSTYDTLNGIPACIVVDESVTSYTNHSENDFYYGEKGGSKLYQYGYNVNCQDNLTAEQRHTILTMQLLSHNITKGEICSILDTNINRGSNRKESKRDWSKAVAKWKEDKQFVLDFDLEQKYQTIDVDKLILKFSKSM